MKKMIIGLVAVVLVILASFIAFAYGFNRLSIFLAFCSVLPATLLEDGRKEYNKERHARRNK